MNVLVSGVSAIPARIGFRSTYTLHANTAASSSNFWCDADGLAAEVLGRTLDELSPQARRLLILLHDMVSQKCRELAIDRSAYRFTRRDVREAIGWSDYQVRVHLNRLVQREYVLPHRGSRAQPAS